MKRSGKYGVKVLKVLAVAVIIAAGSREAQAELPGLFSFPR